MRYTAVVIGVASLLMPVGVAFAQDTESVPVPPPSGEHRPLPPRPDGKRMMNGTSTRPIVAPREHMSMDDIMGSTSRDGKPPMPNIARDGHWASSTSSTTPPLRPHRYKPSDIRSFIKWIFALPASTTIGELRDKIDVSSLTSNRMAASADAPIQGMDLISNFLTFFGFGGGEQY